MQNFLQIISLTVLILFVYTVAGSEQYVYNIKWFEVPLDHFGYATNTTFKIRYLSNNTYDQSGNGPILFYTGNEGDIELFAQNTGFIWETAYDLDALIIFAEHRYYGKSLPFGNKSYDSPAHLGYLTSEQALADYAQLLKTINPRNVRPVIAIGGSYGGMLAAWFRMKYPHLVQGALAASAPVLQFEDLIPCDIFSRIVTSVFKTAYTSNCSVNIKKSWDALKDLSNTDAGRSQLNGIFKFCTPMTKPEDINGFYDYLEDVYGNLAMVNYPYESTFLAPLPPNPVRQFCFQLKDEYKGVDVVKALKNALNVYTNYTGTTKCLDYKSAYEPSMGDQGWNFQACTEMVMPMCSGGQNDMFREKKWDFKKYSDECFQKFSVRPREHDAITTYGGDNLDTASNIIFSNGLLDPWSGGGVLRTTNNKIRIIIIPEGAHHLDLRAANPHDPSSVVGARQLEVKTIKNWIRNFYD